jgi:hypothetical protein
MKTMTVVVLALLAGGVPCFAQEVPVKSDHEMLHKYLAATFGPSGLAHATAFSAWAQFRNATPEWGTTTGAYGKRWASKFTESAIGNTAKFGVARLLHHDPSFVKCECTGFGRRLRHAMISPLVARTRDGRQVFSSASVAGFVTGHVVAKSTWYPARYGAGGGLQDAGMSLATTAGMDVFKEFRPRSKK